MDPVYATSIFVLGLAFGSFLNVCIYRLPLGLSVVSPRSACPACKRPIALYDNVPVLSWLILRGRCRHCKARISPRYLAIELGGWPTLAFCAGVGFEHANSGEVYAAGRCLNSALGH